MARLVTKLSLLKIILFCDEIKSGKEKQNSELFEASFYFLFAD